MQIDKKLCDKFPVVLKNKLLNNGIELPNTTQFEYDDLLTYRAAKRNSDDNREVTLSDFKSYFELHRTPKRPRGTNRNITFLGYKKD